MVNVPCNQVGQHVHIERLRPHWWGHSSRELCEIEVFGHPTSLSSGAPRCRTTRFDCPPGSYPEHAGSGYMCVCYWWLLDHGASICDKVYCPSNNAVMIRPRGGSMNCSTDGYDEVTCSMFCPAELILDNCNNTCTDSETTDCRSYIEMSAATNCLERQQYDREVSVGVRLRGGWYPDSGRVELYHMDHWQSVSNDFWDHDDASVACKQLGYECGEMLEYTEYDVTGSGYYMLRRDFTCDGSETSLADCMTEVPQYGRSTSENDLPVGVKCYNKPDPCLSEPCVNGGLCSVANDTFSCSCPAGFSGVFCEQTQRTAELVPRLSGLVPRFGPQAGGTKLMLTGHFRWPIVSVTLGQYSCILEKPNRTDTILAVTPPCNDSDVNDQLPVTVEYGVSDLLSNDSFNFQYRGNPEIMSIHPLETIVDGGVILTVSGSSMNSVSQPFLQIIMVYRVRLETSVDGVRYNETVRYFIELCEVHNETQMHCPTPKLELPSEFQRPSERENTSASRTRREADDAQLNFKTNDTELTFYLGFLLDGVGEYENVSSHPDLAEYGMLDIFNPPELYNNIQEHFEKDTPLKIMGERLSSGLAISDYLVMIGLGVCENINLTEDTLTCWPPQSAPERAQNRSTGCHIILVFIGRNFELKYGEYCYPEGLDGRIWIVTGCVVFVVVAGIATGTVLAIKRNATPDKTDDKQEESPNVPNFIHLGNVPNDFEEGFRRPPSRISNDYDDDFLRSPIRIPTEFEDLLRSPLKISRPKLIWRENTYAESPWSSHGDTSPGYTASTERSRVKSIFPDNELLQ